MSNTIGTLYVKCDHFILGATPAWKKLYDIQLLNSDTRYKIKSVYDHCPICTKEIEEKQNELQETFEDTFGLLEESQCK